MEKFRQFKRDNGSMLQASGAPVKPMLKFGAGHHASNSVNICIPSYSVNLQRARDAAAKESSYGQNNNSNAVGKSLQARPPPSIDFKFGQVGREQLSPRVSHKQQPVTSSQTPAHLKFLQQSMGQQIFNSRQQSQVKLVKIEGGRTLDVAKSPPKDYIGAEADGPQPNIINHKNGKTQHRPFSGMRPGSMTKQRFMQTAANPTQAWVQDGPVANDNNTGGARSTERSAAVTKAQENQAANCIADYAAKANTTLLQLKAQRVHNNSVQRLMDDIFKRDATGQKIDQPYVSGIKTGESTRHGSQLRVDNFCRYDQSPQPNYPNFEPSQKADGVKNLGQIGWGLDRPNILGANSSQGSSIDRMHIKFWDKKPEQRFMDLSGQFSEHQDKQLNLNGEIYHLMNASAQRISVKSLDMQRQAITKGKQMIKMQMQQQRLGPDKKSPYGPGGSATMSTALTDAGSLRKQSFPEVVGILTNPFARNTLNQAARTNQLIVTPKMQSEFRFSRAAKHDAGSMQARAVRKHNTRAKSYGLK